MNVPRPPNYIAYLVRMWRTDENGKWHATLQDPHTGQHLHFDTVESLFVFLKQQMGEPSPPDLPSSYSQERFSA